MFIEGRVVNRLRFNCLSKNAELISSHKPNHLQSLSYMQSIIKFVLGIFVTLVLAVTFLPRSSGATTSDIYLVNPSTGIAMYGYDLVSYFTEQQALVGEESFEVEWDGGYWHFTNSANADRFLDAPEAFLPQFNGYGAFAVASGRLADGNPKIWALYENQLFFFHSVGARNEWALNPADYVEGGRMEWKNLSLQLVR